MLTTLLQVPAEESLRKGEVVATGGAEGKLLQSVFPYRYAVWDAKFARPAALRRRLRKRADRGTQ